jgi:hypothetical protein
MKPDKWLELACGIVKQSNGSRFNSGPHHQFSNETKGETIMPILSLIFGLVLVGVLLWAVNSFIPMDQKIKTILNIVVVIVVVWWLLTVFGVFGSLNGVRIPIQPTLR